MSEPVTAPLRILLFNTAHRWIGEAAGTDLLAKALAQRGHQVRMAVPIANQIESHLEGAPYDIVRIPWRMPGGAGSSTLEQHRAVARLLREYAPQIVHVGRGKEHWTVALLHPFCASGSSIVRTRHVVLPMRQGWANRWLFRRRTHAVTAISEAAFRGLGTLGEHLPDERLRVVLGAVDTGRYAPENRSEELRGQLGAGDPGTVLIGCLGRFQRIKGYDVFLEAIARVMDRHSNVRAVLAGRKVSLEKPRLLDLHKRLKLEGRIAYLGMIDRPEELIASLDVGVIASRGSEGFSRIAVEYFASGVPVVATQVGALPEIVEHECTGLSVPSEDPAAMAEALERMLEDASLRTRLVHNAHGTLIERFAPARMAAEMETVYRAALAR